VIEIEILLAFSMKTISLAHQLPAAPELVTLGQLLRERRKNRFDLYRVPPAKSAARLIFGGRRHARS